MHILGLLRMRASFVLLTVLSGPFFFSCNSPSHNAPADSDYNRVLDTAYHLYNSRTSEQAIHYLDSATKLFKNLGPHLKFEYYGFHYNHFFNNRNKKDDNKSMLYADSMINVFDTPDKKLKYLSDYDSSYFCKGDALLDENKYDEAYQYFYVGKLIAKKDVNDCRLSNYSYRMGMIMYKQEHYRLAAANFKNASKEIGACDLTWEPFCKGQELLSNTGQCYTKIHEDDSAMMYYKKALDFIDRESNRFKGRKVYLDLARGVIYGNEADTYINKKNFRFAKQLLKQSSEINIRKGYDNQDAEFSELKLAHLYFRANEVDSMFELLHVVHKQLNTVKDQEAEADWNLLMSDYFIKKKDSKTALGYFIKFNALKDSIATRNKGLKDADVSQQIKRLENDTELFTLKKNNQEKDSYLKMAYVFGIMLLTILLLILFNWQKSQRNIKILGGLNHQINDQNYNLEHALEELKLNTHEKDRILRAVAHDLRNPIGGIASLTEAMADDDFTDEQMVLINLIKATANNSLELISEILEVTNNGSTVVNKELVEINSLLSNSVELFRFKAADKKQLIKLQLLNNPVDLFISSEKIWRVISNLISNAIKFSQPGSDIFVNITDVDSEVEISVKDLGIGIPEKMKNKVFNTFTEAGRTGTGGEKSFGLGLSISLQIVENHHGKIWFESDAENGTTFYVRLPKP